MKVISVGKKFDVINDSFENLLWFINHCNIPMANEYVYSAGLLHHTEDDNDIYTIICAYKGEVVNFREFPIMCTKHLNEQGLKEAKMAAYYHLMNQFLLWTGAEYYTKMMIKIRDEFTYLPLLTKHNNCLNLVNEELDKVRIQNAPPIY